MTLTVREVCKRVHELADVHGDSIVFFTKASFMISNWVENVDH